MCHYKPVTEQLGWKLLYRTLPSFSARAADPRIYETVGKSNSVIGLCKLFIEDKVEIKKESEQRALLEVYNTGFL